MLEHFDARRLKLAQTDPTGPSGTVSGAPETALTEPPTLDRSVLLRVFEELGDDAPAVFDQLSVLFLQDTPELLGDLETAFINRDFEQAARIAHRLKGSCAQMGAVGLAGQAEAAEQAATSRNTSELEPRIRALTELWPRTAAELAEWRNAQRTDAAPLEHEA